MSVGFSYKPYTKAALCVAQVETRYIQQVVLIYVNSSQHELTFYKSEGQNG